MKTSAMILFIPMLNIVELKAATERPHTILPDNFTGWTAVGETSLLRSNTAPITDEENGLTTDKFATQFKSTPGYARTDQLITTEDSDNRVVTSSFVEESSTLTDDEETDSPSVTLVSTSLSENGDYDHTYHDLVELDTENIAECLHTNSTIEYGAYVVSVSYYQAPGSNRTAKSPFVCWVNITGPPPAVLAVLITEQIGCSDDNYVIVPHLRKVDVKYDCDRSSWLAPGWNLVTSSNTGHVKIRIGDVSAAYGVRIIVTAMQRPKAKELEHYMVTQMLGFVQTPEWNPDLKVPYPYYMESAVYIYVPLDHTVLISVVHIDIEGKGYSCPYDWLKLYKQISAAWLQLVWTACITPPTPQLLDTEKVVVYFVSDGTGQYYGFRLLYTFHQRSSQPQELPDGKWNCSVPFWPDFKPHFLCNKISECAGGEDEASCPYTLCDDGSLSWGPSCFRFVDPKAIVTWDECNIVCSGLGGRLASLTSPLKRQRVYHFLRVYRSGQFSTYLGLKSAPSTLPSIYRKTMQWQDKTIDYYSTYNEIIGRGTLCAQFQDTKKENRIRLEACNNMVPKHTRCVCERDNPNYSQPRYGFRNTSGGSQIELAKMVKKVTVFDTVKCPKGHVTHAFLACDVQSACWGDDFVTHVSSSDAWAVPTSSSCPAPLTSLPPSFSCRSGKQRVPYSVVCDHRTDCMDSSDEDFCTFPACDQRLRFQCLNKQCVSLSARCDAVVQCQDGSDEERCSTDKIIYHDKDRPSPPALVNFDRYGNVSVIEITTAGDFGLSDATRHSPSLCPETHFQCPGNGYCLPVYLRCNGVYDCSGKEDEEECGDTYTCPDFYRCRASKVCVHASHVCDGWAQCPQRDDEIFCDTTCPDNCTCRGLAFFCKSVFPVHQYPELRYLDARNSGLQRNHLDENLMLIHLGMARCGVSHVTNFTFPNLHSLDLSDNLIQVVRGSELNDMKRLRVLFLASNPLASFFAADSEIHSPFTTKLNVLDLSRVHIQVMNLIILSSFPSIQTLNLSQCGIEEMRWSSDDRTSQLEVLDIRGSPVTAFQRDIFKRLTQLRQLQAENFKLCCSDVLPDEFDLNQCSAPSNEISSCDSLIGSKTFQIIFILLAVVALLSNSASFVVRVFVHRTSNLSSCGVFVTHLSMADFGTGVYLGIIGVADLVYKGVYVWEDNPWRRSAACKAAGFLNVCTSQASTFFVSLMVLDEVLALVNPSRRRLRQFGVVSAHIASSVVWSGSAVLAAIPLAIPRWEFYTQRGTCSPLPVATGDFLDEGYGMGISVILNFILILSITLGLLYIRVNGNKNEISINASKAKSSSVVDTAGLVLALGMAQVLSRLFVEVVVVLAFLDHAVPSELRVSAALIVLPFSSALDPALHAFHIRSEHRQRIREERLRTILAKKLKTQSTRKTTVTLSKKEK